MGGVAMGLLTSPQRFTVKRPEKAYSALGTTTRWVAAGEVSGWIDLITGTDQPTGGGEFAFVEESTHVLITDGMPATTPEDSHVIETSGGRRYHVTYVDDVMGVGHHLEIYLRRAGAEASK